MDILKDLNTAQRDAVTHGSGPLLILAGAGSGKTSVLTRRIAYLIAEHQVNPDAIFGITFTNKAASEMKDRVISLVGSSAQKMWLSTFHSAGVRILRRHGGLIPGKSGNFSIYDTDDTRKIVSESLKDLDLSPQQYTPRGCLSMISRYKNSLITPEEALIQAEEEDDHVSYNVGRVFSRYQERLDDADACDFDDLLVLPLQIFRQNPSIVALYRQRFAHIFIDEYQDTNHAQYALIRLLALREDRTAESSLCAVGDLDQSIYSFRGATIRNIMEFTHDFKDSRVIHLEQNYRSTQNILSAANAVIQSNSSSYGEKKLWTDKGPGEKISLISVSNDIEEARSLARIISALLASGEYSRSDCAIFYRTNAASRSVEEALIQFGIQYQIYGSVRFYDRKEIKDILAYLRIIVNPYDSVSLARVINTPRRGIGEKTLRSIQQRSRELGLSLIATIEHMSQDGASQFKGKSRLGMQQFCSLLTHIRGKLSHEHTRIDAIIHDVLEQSGYLEELQKSLDPQDKVRIENIDELVSVAAEFSSEYTVEQDKDDAIIFDEMSESNNTEMIPDVQAMQLPPGMQMLSAFLEKISLVSGSEQPQQSEQDASLVTLMTVHTAKGLEFPVVFVVGMNEGIFPHTRALGNPQELEEERRLAYVALTRAQKKLILLHAATRSQFGVSLPYLPSRFITEIPESIVEKADLSESSEGTSQRTHFAEKRREHAASRHMPEEIRDARSVREPAARSAPSKGKRSKTFAYVRGDVVRHEKFGVGVISDVTGAGMMERITLDLGTRGTVTLMTAAGLPLEKIS